jgi:hypothetical protein
VHLIRSFTSSRNIAIFVRSANISQEES